MSSRERIIMDVDPGIDDSLAILLALRSPEIIVEGITVVSGNIEVNQGCKNALKAISMVPRKDIKVYKGNASPLVKPYINATETHGADGIGENYFEDVGMQCQEEHAVDFIVKKINKNPGEITLLAIGPLTNVAVAIQKDKNIVKNIKRIVLMGGTAKFHGNCSPVAEYNFWVDPDAAKIVFNSGIDITMIGLDVTHNIILTPNIIEVLKQLNTTISKYIVDITKFYVNFHWKQERTIGCVINDPLAVAVLIDSSMVEARKAWVDIETHGIAVGQSVVDFGGVWSQGRCNSKICMKVIPKRFFELFLHRMVPEYPEDIKLAIEKEYGCKGEMI